MAHQVADGTAAGVRTNYRVIRYTARTAPTGERHIGVHMHMRTDTSIAEVMPHPALKGELPWSMIWTLYGAGIDLQNARTLA